MSENIQGCYITVHVSATDKETPWLIAHFLRIYNPYNESRLKSFRYFTTLFLAACFL